MKALAQYIEMALANGGGSYKTAIDCDGDQIKIRVSDHSCNDRNNDGKTCLSFITKSTLRSSGQWQNDTEWVMEYSEEREEWFDKNGNTIEEILSDYSIVSFK